VVPALRQLSASISGFLGLINPFVQAVGFHLVLLESGTIAITVGLFFAINAVQKSASRLLWLQTQIDLTMFVIIALPS